MVWIRTDLWNGNIKMPYSFVEFRQKSTQLWVGVYERNPLDEDGIRLWGLGTDGLLTFLYDDVPGESWNRPRLDAATVYIQENLIDFKILLADLPDAWPEKTVDPELPHYFWDGLFLVSRPILLSNLNHDNNVLGWTLTALN
jgi:hypothetical protein